MPPSDHNWKYITAKWKHISHVDIYYLTLNGFIHPFIQVMHSRQKPYLHIKLTFSTRPFKCQFSAVAGALFNLKAHCGTVFFCLEKEVLIYWENAVPFIC
jgi:hypothetical protein